MLEDYDADVRKSLLWVAASGMAGVAILVCVVWFLWLR